MLWVKADDFAAGRLKIEIGVDADGILGDDFTVCDLDDHMCFSLTDIRKTSMFSRYPMVL